MRKNAFLLHAIFMAGVILVSMVPLSSAFAQEKFTVAYGPEPSMKSQVQWMEKFVTKNFPNVKFDHAELPYEVFVQKMITNLMRPEGEYNIFWLNDDWAKLFGRYLEPIDDVPALSKIDKKEWVNGIFDWDGRITGLPWMFASGWLVYRTDLMPKPPTTWKEIQEMSMALQRSGKVKWGFVAGMAYPHDMFSLLWTQEANAASLYSPYLERDNSVLARNGWKSMATTKEFLEHMYFWWDNIHKYKICSPGIVSYTRYEANGIFMKGDVAMTFNDDRAIRTALENPKESQVAGKIDIAPGPPGPHGKKPVFTGGPWAWAIPKNSKNKDIAKKVIDYAVGDKEAQKDLWVTGKTMPQNLEAIKELMAQDKEFEKYAGPVIRGNFTRLASIYLHPKYDQMHTIYNKYAVKALTGPREKIVDHMKALKKELEELMAGEK